MKSNSRVCLPLAFLLVATIWENYVVYGFHPSRISRPSPSKHSVILNQKHAISSFDSSKETISSTSLQSASSSSNQGAADQIDLEAIAKYVGAIGIQMGLLFGFMTTLDIVSDKLPFEIPFLANCALFYGLSLKSRVFNPLANNRPKVDTLEATQQKRVMPSWTPPGPVFPIVWLLLIGPLRAYTASMIVDTTDVYACLPIMAFLLHLSIGDVWNTINNVERRYGAAVTGVGCVWLSKAHAAYQYYQVNPEAGQLLSLALIWLTIAGALVTATWRLNPNAETGEVEPLYPVVSNHVQTEFIWFKRDQ